MAEPEQPKWGIAPFEQYFARNREAAEELRSLRVLIAGLGTTGSAAAKMLAKAGVGSFVFFDPDRVEVENLHRQEMRRAHLEMNKAEAIADDFRNECSSDQTFVGFPGGIENYPEDAVRVCIEHSDVVIAATGSDVADRLLNRLCRETRTPLVVPSLHPDDWEEAVGRVHVVDWRNPPRDTACFECLHPRPQGRGLARAGLSGQRGQPMDLWPVANLTAQFAIAVVLSDSQRGRWLARELSAGFNEFQVGRLLPQVSPTRTHRAVTCTVCQANPQRAALRQRTVPQWLAVHWPRFGRWQRSLARFVESGPEARVRWLWRFDAHLSWLVFIAFLIHRYFVVIAIAACVFAVLAAMLHFFLARESR